MHNTPRNGRRGFMTSLAIILQRIYDFFQWFQSRDKHKEIEKAKQELAKALAEGNITDAAYWRNQLAILTKTIMIAFVLLQGCLSAPKTEQPIPVQPVEPTVVIGERINKVKAGDLVKIPPLIQPAKQWYLVDNVGLYQWIQVDLEGKKSINP